MFVQGEAGAVVKDTASAIEYAQENGMDLVQIGFSNGMPVCKMVNYDKFMYDLRKKEKRNNKNKQELKEVRLKDNIADNDLNIKAKTISRILKEGDKVKVVLIYKGRAVTFISRGVEKLNELDGLIEQEHSLDVAPRIDGNKVYMMVSPKNK